MNWEEWFYYDETSSSCLRWKVDIYDSLGRLTKARIGRVAGGLDSTSGYHQLRLQQVTYQIHRIIYELKVSEIPEGCDIDHEDRNRANNKMSNLRATKLNNRNLPLRSNSASGVCGVTKILNGWQAQWRDLEGVKHSKYFSSNKYGDENAKNLAITVRVSAISELNKLGAGYTETHGKKL